MSKMIQLRHVPDSLHKQLKSRAAKEHMSLSEFLIREVRKIADQPSLAEMLARIAKRDPALNLPETPAAAVRAERDSR